MSRLNLLGVVAVALFASSALAQEPAAPHKRSLAVLDFTSETVEGPVVRQFCGALGAQLAGIDTFQVIERNQADEILKEQAFQGSGACKAEACFVEMGQMLGIEWMVIGTLEKIDSSFVTNAKLVDVGSGAVLKQTMALYRGGAAGLVAEGSADVLARLMGFRVIQEQRGAAGKASLKIESRFADTRLLLNDSLYGEGSMTIRDLSPGTYGVRAEKRDFLPQEWELELGANEHRTLAVVLEPSARTFAMEATSVTVNRSPLLLLGEDNLGFGLRAAFNKRTGKHPWLQQSWVVDVERYSGAFPGRLEVVDAAFFSGFGHLWRFDRFARVGPLSAVPGVGVGGWVQYQKALKYPTDGQFALRNEPGSTPVNPQEFERFEVMVADLELETRLTLGSFCLFARSRLMAGTRFGVGHPEGVEDGLAQGFALQHRWSTGVRIGL